MFLALSYPGHFCLENIFVEKNKVLEGRGKRFQPWVSNSRLLIHWTTVFSFLKARLLLIVALTLSAFVCVCVSLFVRGNSNNTNTFWAHFWPLPLCDIVFQKQLFCKTVFEHWIELEGQCFWNGTMLLSTWLPLWLFLKQLVRNKMIRPFLDLKKKKYLP